MMKLYDHVAKIVRNNFLAILAVSGLMSFLGRTIFQVKAFRLFIIAGLTIIFIIAFNTSSSAQAWFNPSWTYRKAITIDFTKVSAADQANFPVLVSLSADAGLSAHALANGNDILFTLGDGTTQIPYQRESYAGGTLTAWVKVTTVSHTANTVIYMYYGNAGAGDQQQAANVWDANYAGVYHINEPGAGTAGEYKESKAGAINGTVNDQVLRAVYNMSTSANSYCYQELTAVSNYLIAAGDVVVYDVYWTSSTDLAAFDFTCTDNSTFRDAAGNVDQNGLASHPATNLSAFALNKWYHRVIPISAALVGKTITNFDIACEADGGGARTAYFDNIYILSSTGTISRVVYTQNGTTTNSTRISASGTSTSMGNVADPTLPRSVAGKINNSVNADGARFLNMSARATNVTDNFTLEAWVNPNILSQHGYFVYNGNQAAGYGIGIGNGTGNLGNKLIGLFGANGFVPTNFTFPSAATWYHVAMQRSSGTTSFFVNGTPVSAASNATLAPTTPSNSFTIGNELDAASIAYKYFNGPIDEVRISTTARNAGWIATEYNNQSSPATFYTVGAETLLAPIITSFTPASGCANTTPVIITGINFAGATSVKFGGTDALSFVINSATQITAIPASGTTGTISVAAPIGPTGVGTSASTFTVNPVPKASVLTQSNINCFGTNDGTITVSGSEGTPPYWYSVYNGVAHSPFAAYQPSNSFTGLGPGTYQIRVKDNNGTGCESKPVQ